MYKMPGGKVQPSSLGKEDKVIDTEESEIFQERE